MSIFGIRDLRRPSAGAFALAVALCGALLAWPQAGFARRQGAFAEFAGDWRGGGRVATTDGRTEAINCRARYEVAEGGASLSQSLVCASDSYRFDIRSDVVAEAGSVTGTWQETTRNVGGNLSGQIENGVFEGSVDGGGFTASITLRTNGHAQTVEITPHAGFIAKVDVTMRRAG